MPSTPYASPGRSLRRAVIVSAITAPMCAVAAFAAQWNGLTSTATRGWYESTTDRHITTPNDTIKMFKTWGCTVEGLRIFVMDKTTHTEIGATRTFFPNGVEQTFASNVNGHPVFHNVYQIASTTANSCDWTAQEWY